MKCPKCKIELKPGKNDIVVGSANKGIRFSLEECPQCGFLKKKEEKITF